MLIKRVEEVTLTFDDDKEALVWYKDIKGSECCVDSKIYKDYSVEFKKWVYKIDYKIVRY